MIFEYELNFFAHHGSGFHSWNMLNKLSTWCKITNPIKTSKGSVTVKTFNGLCDVEEIGNGKLGCKKFVCSIKQFNGPGRNLGTTNGIQQELLNFEKIFKVIYENISDDLNDEWLSLRNMF